MKDEEREYWMLSMKKIAEISQNIYENFIPSSSKIKPLNLLNKLEKNKLTK